MKKSQFENMIRTIVKQVVSEEIRNQLPQLVSEMYIKRLVSEASGPPRQRATPARKAAPRRLSLEQAFEQEMAKTRDEHIPEPMDNSDEGIYQQQTQITRKNESVRSRLLSNDNNKFASMYEGVQPIERQVAGQQFVPSAENLPMIPPTEVDAEGTVVAGNPASYGEFFKKMVGQSANKGPIEQSNEVKMRQLEEQRRKLDERKVG
ncbi:MAG: hypothetical protein ACW987_18765 [Candidatus Thorarchaeota archaeon]|jgi:hypothetical protein